MFWFFNELEDLVFEGQKEEDAFYAKKAAKEAEEAKAEEAEAEEASK